MIIFILIFSSLFSILGLWYEINNLVKYKNLTTSSLVGIMFILTYGVLPFIVICMYRFYGISISTRHYQYDYSDNGLVQTFMWQISGVIAYIIIRRITRKANRVSYKKAPAADYSLLQVTLCISLIVGVVSLYLWSKAFGSITNLIIVASRVRSGLINVNNGLAFFKHPARLVLITTFGSLVLAKKKYNVLFNSIVFFISFSFSILFLMANDGRMSFAMYFAVIFSIIFDVFSVGKFIKKRLLCLFIMALLGMIFILKLDSITYFIRYGTFESATETPFLVSVVNEFAYVMISGQKAIEHASTFNFLIADDILNGLQAWLPTSLKPFDVLNIWNYNTILTTNDFFGQFPCDFASTSLYDLSFVGSLVFGVFWGMILKKIEVLRNKNSTFSDVCYYAFSTSLFRLVDYCMLYDFVLGIFSATIFVLIYSTVRILFVRKNIK